MLASAGVCSYGVAGSPLVPTTRIGGAPSALPVGYGSRLPGHCAQIRFSARLAPNSGYLVRHSPCRRRASSTVTDLSSSAQLTARLASKRLEYLPLGSRSAYR